MELLHKLYAQPYKKFQERSQRDKTREIPAFVEVGTYVHACHS